VLEHLRKEKAHKIPVPVQGKTPKKNRCLKRIKKGRGKGGILGEENTDLEKSCNKVKVVLEDDHVALGGGRREDNKIGRPMPTGQNPWECRRRNRCYCKKPKVYFGPKGAKARRTKK